MPISLTTGIRPRFAVVRRNRPIEQIKKIRQTEGAKELFKRIHKQRQREQYFPPRPEYKEGIKVRHPKSDRRHKHGRRR